jgi:predicted SAM-dependent methyltransferase
MDGLRLHLGCGSTVVEGWVNIDRSPNVWLTRVPTLRPALRRARILTEDQASAVFPPGIVRADVRRGLRYPDKSVSYIYSSHLIEHLSRWEGLELLRECRRVLATGGLVRLATPDLAELVGEYVRGETPLGPTAADSFMEQLLTFREVPGSVVQRVARRLVTAPHQWLYDAESLRRLLDEAGFADAERRSFHDSSLPDIDLLEDRPESLFMETRAS